MNQDKTHAHYRCLTKTFIAPERLEEGEDFWISPSWEPGVHVEPLNDLAEEAMKKFLAANPNKAATLNPIEELPNTLDGGIIKGDGPPAEDTTKTLTLAEASAGKASPGLSEGGKATKAS